MITLQNLTMTYRNGKGVFDLSFDIREGEVFGYLGPNGAGKTTTIRNLLGFVRPNSGSCRIRGLDCSRDAVEIQKSLGYIPGETAFFDGMTGTAYLDLISAMRKLTGQGRRKELLERFELEASGKIRKMSKGMRQKLGIVAAFLHDPAVLVLDEPTSGLDPLMQNIFIGLIMEERERGKTILMSSHQFEEVSRTCDRAGIIRDGRLAAVEDVQRLRNASRHAYQVTLKREEDIGFLRNAGLEVGQTIGSKAEVFVRGDVDAFIKTLASVQVSGLEAGTQSLEQIFMHFYGKEGVES